MFLSTAIIKLFESRQVLQGVARKMLDGGVRYPRDQTNRRPILADSDQEKHVLFLVWEQKDRGSKRRGAASASDNRAERVEKGTPGRYWHLSAVRGGKNHRNLDGAKRGENEADQRSVAEKSATAGGSVKLRDVIIRNFLFRVLYHARTSRGPLLVMKTSVQLPCTELLYSTHSTAHREHDRDQEYMVDQHQAQLRSRICSFIFR
ncbi:unnamed protein product [Amoebophrya sp. A120]|nr:unnamed protein product [Amoebophrya sp. A120]|eukprot:GSA120T00022444001.1